MAIEMGEVACPAAHPRFPQRKNFSPEETLIFPSEERPIRPLLVFLAQFWLLLMEMHDQITSLPVRTLISLILISHSYTPRHTLLDVQLKALFLPPHPIPTTQLALMLDRTAPSAADIALHLHLLENTWS